MALIVFTTCTSSPGVTTAALAAAVHWPRPVLVIEADIASVGSTPTGFFRANLDTTAGLHQLSLAHARDALTPDALIDPGFGIAIAVHALPPVARMPIPALPPGHRMWVIPGYRDLTILPGVHAIWSRLPALAAGLGEDGIDVLIDLGRLGIDDPRLPLLDAADQVVFLAGSTMTDLHRTHSRLRLPDLADRIPGTDRHTLLLTQAPVESVRPVDFARLGIPVLATVRFDPVGAAVFAHGHDDPRPGRNQYRTDLRAAVLALTARLAARTNRDLAEVVG